MFDRVIRLICLLAPLAAASPGGASPLVLNAYGTSLGLTITTVVSGFELGGPCMCGPIGMTSTSDGFLLVSDYAGRVYRFNDVDNQVVANALGVVTPGGPNLGANAMALSGGVVYAVRNQQLYSLNNDGTTNSLFFGGAAVTSGGLAANPVTGHLYSNSNISPGQNLADLDPISNTYGLHPAGGGEVGSVSLDGSVVYVSHYPNLIAHSTTTYGVIWVSDRFGGATGTLQTGSRAGDLVSYDETTGELLLFDRLTGLSTLIGSGGGPFNRGQLIAIDHNNGSLLFSLNDSVLRIAVAGNTAVPEPSSLVILIAALGAATCLGFARSPRNRC